MLKSGLVSVSFRQKTPEEIIALVEQCGLDGIEWGGDVHVTPGDTENAGRIGDLTRQAGLEVLAYGSYFRPGEQRAAAFAPVLASAKALGRACHSCVGRRQMVLAGRRSLCAAGDSGYPGDL